MKFKGFDGREYSCRLKYEESKNCSKPHKKVRELIKEIYPSIGVVEELVLKGSKTVKNKTLTADFYIPSLNLVIEIHGEQHYRYIPHFHKTKMDFVQGRARDRTKIEWCELNNIDIVVLKHDEEDEWREQIEGR